LQTEGFLEIAVIANLSMLSVAFLEGAVFATLVLWQF